MKYAITYTLYKEDALIKEDFYTSNSVYSTRKQQLAIENQLVLKGFVKGVHYTKLVLVIENLEAQHTCFFCEQKKKEEEVHTIENTCTICSTCENVLIAFVDQTKAADPFLTYWRKDKKKARKKIRVIEQLLASTNVYKQKESLVSFYKRYESVYKKHIDKASTN